MPRPEDHAERGGAGRGQRCEAYQRDGRPMSDRLQLRLRRSGVDATVAKSVDQIHRGGDLSHVHAQRIGDDGRGAQGVTVVDRSGQFAPTRQQVGGEAERTT